MKNFFLFGLCLLTTTPALSSDLSRKESYEIVTKGKVLQSGVYARSSSCGSRGCYNSHSMLVSLIMYKKQLYKCHVGANRPGAFEWVDDFVNCFVITKTK